MNKDLNPYEVFQEEAPEVFNAFNGLVQSLINTKSLDEKTKQLLYIGMKIVTGDLKAVIFHIPMAKAAGVTREQLRDTILLTLTISGLKGIDFLPGALDIYDNGYNRNLHEYIKTKN